MSARSARATAEKSMQLHPAGQAWPAAQRIPSGKQKCGTGSEGGARHFHCAEVHSLSAVHGTRVQVQVAGPFSQTGSVVNVPPSGSMPPEAEQILLPGLHVNGAAQFASVAQVCARAGAIPRNKPANPTRAQRSNVV
jgi:hypothetical protein